jgi:hypothetical protein
LGREELAAAHQERTAGVDAFVGVNLGVRETAVTPIYA